MLKVARRIVEEHIGQGKKVKENEIDLNSPFFTSQKRIVLENMGKINAESIEEYIAAGGYEALAKTLTELSPEEVISEIRKVGCTRQRRRRLSHRIEMGYRPQRCSRPKVRYLQCR